MIRYRISFAGAAAFAVASLLLAGSAYAAATYPDGDNAAVLVGAGVVDSVDSNGKAQAVRPTAPMPVQQSPLGADPCANPNVAKSSVAIAVSSATTTQLVALAANKTTYVCGGALSIAPSATSADTAQFEHGGSTTCTSPTVLTGAFGAGDLTTAAPPAIVTLNSAMTNFTSAVGDALCLLTAGTTVNVQGYITYVQQ